MYTQPHQPTSHQPDGRYRLKSHRPRAIRPLGRYGGAHATRDSPSDIGVCHRVVRRHTRCSPVTRRSMRATQAHELASREPRLDCAFASQQPSPAASPKAPKAASKSEPRGPSQLGVVRGVARKAPSQLRIATIRHVVRKFSFLFCLVLVVVLVVFFWAGHFRARANSRSKVVPLGIRLKPTRPSHGRVSRSPHPPEARQVSTGGALGKAGHSTARERARCASGSVAILRVAASISRSLG